MKKRIHDLKVGDVVTAHGGKFRVTENARESQGHRPQAAHLTTAHGPCDCAVAKAVCIEGRIQGYFAPGSTWTFQGNFLAPLCTMTGE
jgi:hypothetical protein